MPSPADRVATLLTNANLCGGATGWASYVGGFGDTDQAICCFDGAGRQPEVGVAIDYPTLQVMVRCAKGAGQYSVGQTKSRAIYDLLHAITPAQVAADFPELTSCVARGGIQPLSMDALTRHVFSVNFNLIVTPTVLGNRS